MLSLRLKSEDRLHLSIEQSLCFRFALSLSIVELKTIIIMETKKITIETLVEKFMDKLFQLIEYVCDNDPFLGCKPSAPAVTQNTAAPICFSSDDQLVEGELFG